MQSPGESQRPPFHFRSARFKSFLLAVVLGLPSTLLGDTTTFAQFVESGTGGNDFSFVSAANLATFASKDPQSASISVPVMFTFLGVDNLPADLKGPQAAQLSFSVTTNQRAVASGGYFTQGLSAQTLSGMPEAGSIMITRDVPDRELHQTNLLSVSLYGGSLFGVQGGHTASLTADSSLGGQGQTEQVVFSSSYLAFSKGEENLAFSFTSANPRVTINPALSFLSSFVASGTGSFAADPTAVSAFPTPEPSTLGTLVSALIVGWALRRRLRHGHR